MTKTALGVLIGIIGALILIHIYRRYQNAQALGQPFGLDDVIGTMSKSYSYVDAKCYETNTNSLTGNVRKTVVDDRMCYGLPTYITALTSEYTNLQNQISALPNPNDPNYQSNLAMWQARVAKIIETFKTIKGCTADEGFDVGTMTCLKM